MKYAWWFFFFIAIFLLCTQRVAAAEISAFDPTAQYVVHSVPLVVSESPLPAVLPTVAPSPQTLAQSSHVTPSPIPEKVVTDITVSDEPEQTSFLSKVGQQISSLISKIKEAI